MAPSAQTTEQIKDKRCTSCVAGHHQSNSIDCEKRQLVLPELVSTISEVTLVVKEDVLQEKITSQPKEIVPKKEEKVKPNQENKTSAAAAAASCVEKSSSGTKFDQMISRIEHSFNGVRNLLTSKSSERIETTTSTVAKTTSTIVTTSVDVSTDQSKNKSDKIKPNLSAVVGSTSSTPTPPPPPPQPSTNSLPDKNGSPVPAKKPMSVLRKRTSTNELPSRPIKRVVFADGVRPGDVNIVENNRQSSLYNRSRHSLITSLPVSQPRLTFVPLLGYGGFSLSGQYGSAALNRCPAMKAVTNAHSTNCKVNRISNTKIHESNGKPLQSNALLVKQQKQQLCNKSQLNMLDHSHHFNAWIPYTVDEEAQTLLCASRVNQTFILGWLIKNV